MENKITHKNHKNYENYGNCKNCKYWKHWKSENISIRVCEAVDIYIPSKTPDPMQFEIFVWAHDDSGIRHELVTGPDFGCIHFKERENNDDVKIK